MRLKLNFIFFVIALFILFISISFIAYRSENHDKGIIEFDNQQYSEAKNFQINQSYFDNNGKLKSDYATHIANINWSPVYSINGLDMKDWIYYDYADCDVSFYLSKNINTKLNNDYFDFSNKFQLIKYNYTIENGYFIGSNTNNLNTKVDNSIHEMISRLK